MRPLGSAGTSHDVFRAVELMAVTWQFLGGESGAGDNKFKLINNWKNCKNVSPYQKYLFWLVKKPCPQFCYYNPASCRPPLQTCILCKGWFHWWCWSSCRLWYRRDADCSELACSCSPCPCHSGRHYNPWYQDYHQRKAPSSGTLIVHWSSLLWLHLEDLVSLWTTREDRVNITNIAVLESAQYLQPSVW